MEKKVMLKLEDSVPEVVVIKQWTVTVPCEIDENTPVYYIICYLNTKVMRYIYTICRAEYDFSVEMFWLNEYRHLKDLSPCCIHNYIQEYEYRRDQYDNDDRE